MAELGKSILFWIENGAEIQPRRKRQKSSAFACVFHYPSLKYKCFQFKHIRYGKIAT